MLVYEFKLVGKVEQHNNIDEAIRVTQFIRNKCLRLWMDKGAKTEFDLNKYCAVLAKEFDFAAKLNSMARQSAAARTWASISRFFDNCKKKVQGKKGFPKFQKDCRSVEYKTTGWKLSDDRKRITFTDKCNIGTLKLKGIKADSKRLDSFQSQPLENIKRVRIVRKGGNYYVQFCVKFARQVSIEPSNQNIGLDVGLKYFYTDSNGETVENPRYLRKAETRLKRLQRRLSKKQKGSNNRIKTRRKLTKAHSKVSRQRKDFAVKLARCVITSNDVVVYESLNIKGMVKNHKLAKSINDAGWYLFRMSLEYFAKVYNKTVISVAPHYTSVNCSNCGNKVNKTLSTRTHLCSCGTVLDRDHNAAINILNKGLLSTVGHTGIKACGEKNPCLS